jgi:hypothetical protein
LPCQTKASSGRPEAHGGIAEVKPWRGKEVHKRRHDQGNEERGRELKKSREVDERQAGGI